MLATSILVATRLFSLAVVIGLGALAVLLLPWTEQEQQDTEGALRALALATVRAPLHALHALRTPILALRAHAAPLASLRAGPIAR